MKKLLTVLSLCLSFTLSASHFMGGIIQVAQTSPDSVSIGMYIVGDQFPTLPQYVTLERWEMNSQGWYDLDGYITLTKINNSTHQGFNTANYGSDYINLDSNKYRFIYTNCCWPVLINSSNSTTSDFVISTDYWHVPNNTTPFMEQPLGINVESNIVNVMKPVWGQFNCHFTNPDGDSVNIQRTGLYSSYSNGVFVPQIQTSTHVLANNDSITFVGTNLGTYGYGFQIDKYRSGYLLTTQRIQWTFVVRSSTLGIEENALEKEVIGVWDWQGRYIQKDIKGLTGLYLIRYSDGSYDKVFLMKQ
jgi:hypothetical protein